MHTTTVTTTKEIQTKFKEEDIIIGKYADGLLEHALTIKRTGIYPDALPRDIPCYYSHRIGEPIYCYLSDGYSTEFWNWVEKIDNGTFTLKLEEPKFKVGDKIVGKFYYGGEQKSITITGIGSYPDDLPNDYSEDTGLIPRNGEQIYHFVVNGIAGNYPKERWAFVESIDDAYFQLQQNDEPKFKVGDRIMNEAGRQHTIADIEVYSGDSPSYHVLYPDRLGEPIYKLGQTRWDFVKDIDQEYSLVNGYDERIAAINALTERDLKKIVLDLVAAKQQEYGSGSQIDHSNWMSLRPLKKLWEVKN